jgi:hypothetical protein
MGKMKTKLIILLFIGLNLISFTPARAVEWAQSPPPTVPSVWLPFISSSDPCLETGCLPDLIKDPPCIFATSFSTASTGFGLDTDYAFSGAKICKVIIDDGIRRTFTPYSGGDQTYAIFWDSVFQWNETYTGVVPGHGVAILAAREVTVYLEFYIEPE